MRSTAPELSENDLSLNAWQLIKHTGWGKVTLWALLTGSATALITWLYLPTPYMPGMTLLGLLLGVVAAVDYKTYLIKDAYSITSLVLVLLTSLSVILLGANDWWSLLWGLIGALAMFGIFYFLVKALGFSSGGDIKFAPGIAFILTTINPLLPFIWLMMSFVISAVILAVKKSKHVAFGVGMAIAAPLSIPITVWILSFVNYTL